MLVAVAGGAAGGGKGGGEDGDGGARFAADGEGDGEFGGEVAAQGGVDLAKQGAAPSPMGPDELLGDGHGFVAGAAAGVAVDREDGDREVGFGAAQGHAGVEAGVGEDDAAIGGARQVVGEDDDGGHQERRAARTRAAHQAVATGTRRLVTMTEAATRTVAGAAASR